MLGRLFSQLTGTQRGDGGVTIDENGTLGAGVVDAVPRDSQQPPETERAGPSDAEQGASGDAQAYTPRRTRSVTFGEPPNEDARPHGAIQNDPPETRTPSNPNQPVEDAATTPAQAQQQSASSKIRRKFTETDFMDSGMGRSLTSELPFLGLPEELDDKQYDELFTEEYLLSKLQDAQRRLQEIRDYKESVIDQTPGTDSPVPAPREIASNVMNQRATPNAHNTTPTASSKRSRRTERLFVASYLLPLKIEVHEDGSIKSNQTTGGLGLVSAFRELLGRLPIVWLGAPGQLFYKTEGELTAARRQSIERHLRSQPSRHNVGLLTYAPLFPDEEDAAAHREFSDQVLWQLFHYLPLSFEGERVYNPDMFAAYERVNAAYAEALIEQWEASGVREEDAMFWIHDFTLFLVPKLLRERMPNASIGFFLHTPFPAGEVYRTLPARKELLLGMLGADLIGFHTYDYARHFLGACERLLGLKTRADSVDNGGVFVQVGIYPFGIDTDSFRNAMQRSSVRKIRDDLKESLAGKKVIVGVDRLDFIKGIPNKLLGLEHFLETNPEWRGRVLLLQVATPSQSSYNEYQAFRSEVLEMVGRINGRFGTLESMPIHYREHNLSFEELCALYGTADVAVLTSLRDGMNLVSYEYVMCQAEHHGALVISEFTGAAQNLPGAILCNPWNIEDVSNAMQKALEMSDVDREVRHRKLYRHVMLNTSAAWGVRFVDDLVKYSARRREAVAKLVELPFDKISHMYSAARKRLLLLDYDGTLRKYELQPELAEPSDALKTLLQRLTEDPANVVFIVTGRQKATMMEWFEGTGLGFAVEHGYALRWPDHLRTAFRGRKYMLVDDDITPSEDPAAQWDSLLGADGVDAMHAALRRADALLRRLEMFMPTSFISTKESALTWHFREADPYFAYAAAHDARQTLDEILTGTPMEVFLSSDSEAIHVRPRGVCKGAAAAQIFRLLAEAAASPDFVMSIGDDRTDEDMFHAVHARKSEGCQIATCTVGRKTTDALYYVEGVDDVVRLLSCFARISEKPSASSHDPARFAPT